MLYGFELHNIIHLEKKRTWQDQYLPSWNHTRVTLFYVFITTYIYCFLLLNNYHIKIYNIVLSVLWTAIFIDDWNLSIWSSAEILLLKYGSKKNPIGVTLTIIGVILLCINCFVFYFEIYNNFEWFIYIHFSVYILISLLNDIIYARVAHHWMFHTNGIVSGQIYAFKETFLAILFGYLHRITRYVVIITIVLVKLFGDDSDPECLFYIQPILLQIWLILLYLAAKDNRPQICQCAESHCQRPIIEYLWRHAVINFKKRNPDDVVSEEPEWRNIASSNIELE